MPHLRDSIYDTHLPATNGRPRNRHGMNGPQNSAGEYTLLKWQALSCLTRFTVSAIKPAIAFHHMLKEISPFMWKQGICWADLMAADVVPRGDHVYQLFMINHYRLDWWFMKSNMIWYQLRKTDTISVVAWHRRTYFCQSYSWVARDWSVFTSKHNKRKNISALCD